VFPVKYELTLYIFEEFHIFLKTEQANKHVTMKLKQRKKKMKKSFSLQSANQSL
jgi:hypothetical protein